MTSTQAHLIQRGKTLGLTVDPYEVEKLVWDLTQELERALANLETIRNFMKYNKN